MKKDKKNIKNIVQKGIALYWKALSQLKFLPFIVALTLTIIIVSVIIPLVINDGLLIYGDKMVTLSIFTSMLAGLTVFLTIELFQKIFLNSTKNSYKIFYDDIFGKHGLEDIFPKRGINEEYSKRILKAKTRIWAIGMTNGNLLQHQLDNILKRVSSESSLDVKFSFWASKTNLQKEYNLTKTISLINQQLHIEDGTGIHDDLIESRHSEIINKYDNFKNKKSGNLSIVEVSLPTNFSCFIIDDDVFFFPFLSTVESTSSPIILCNLNRGIGKEIFNHLNKIFGKDEVTKSIFDS
jgi:hypothetical protein